MKNQSNRVGRWGQVVLSLGLLLAFSTAVEAKFYKWVDKDGNVQYTQTPPPPGAGSEAEQMKLNTRGGTNVSVETRNGRSYCGNTALPQMGDDMGKYIRSLHRHLDVWRENEQYALRQNQNYSAQTLNESRCAIYWGEAQLSRLADEEKKFTDEYSGAKTELAELEAKQQACDGGNKGILVGEEAQAWGKCYKRYEPRIRELRKIVKKYK